MADKSKGVGDVVRGAVTSPSFWGAVLLAAGQILTAVGSGHFDLGTILAAVGIVGAQVAGHSDAAQVTDGGAR